MTDLIERLERRKAFGLNGHTWIMLAQPDSDCQEAAARIRELEAERDKWKQRASNAAELLELRTAATIERCAQVAAQAEEDDSPMSIAYLIRAIKTPEKPPTDRIDPEGGIPGRYP